MRMLCPQASMISRGMRWRLTLSRLTSLASPTTAEMWVCEEHFELSAELRPTGLGPEGDGHERKLPRVMETVPYSIRSILPIIFCGHLTIISSTAPLVCFDRKCEIPVALVLVLYSGSLGSYSLHPKVLKSIILSKAEQDVRIKVLNPEAMMMRTGPEITS